MAATRHRLRDGRDTWLRSGATAAATQVPAGTRGRPRAPVLAALGTRGPAAGAATGLSPRPWGQVTPPPVPSPSKRRWHRLLPGGAR